jgi:hypothetical protein
MPAFMFDAPAAWDPEVHGRSERSALSSDQCVIEDEQWYLRGLLAIPVQDAEDVVFGVWLSVSEGTFERAIELWDDDRRRREPPYPGWLANTIPGYADDTVGLLARLKQREPGKRPLVQVDASTEHELATDQSEGVRDERAAQLADVARRAGTA